MQIPLAVHREHGARLHPLLEKLAELVRAEGRARPQIGRPRPRRAGLAEVLLQHLGGRALVEKLQVREQRRALSLEARRRDVEQRAAPDRDDGRIGADHVAVAGQRDDRRLQAEAPIGHLARLELRAVDEEDAGHHLLRAHVEAHPVAHLERPRGIGQELEGGVGQERGQERARRRHHVAPLDGRPLHALAG